MGIYSTCQITRNEAIELLGVSGLSNEELKKILFMRYGDKTYFNFNVVNEYENDFPRKYKDNKYDFRD